MHPSMQVVTKARTTKIHLERSSASDTPVARGVEFSLADNAFGERFTASLAPGGEVLLCSGAVHSPHLLQLSGVGDAAHLAEHDIQPLVDLPGVGANLQVRACVCVDMERLYIY